MLDPSFLGARCGGDGTAPLQNRVLPTGEIVADPGRGLLMGNRGCLHDRDRRLGAARWRSNHWICCTLTWRDVRRDPMPPGRWTALFFLDEATALAAGHRPCAYCRRAAFNDFARSWHRAHGGPEPPRAGAMDSRLHGERVDPRTRRQRTCPAAAVDLPDGVMVRRAGVVGLVREGSVLPWSFAGYAAPVAMSSHARVELLTPPATVATIAAGYVVSVHPSARGPGVSEP
jgi:hypothetical protein